MKRIGQFIFLLLSFIIIAYAQPLLFPREQDVKIVAPAEETDVTLTHTSFPYGEIKATGLAGFIGQAPQELTKIYGEPLEIQETGLGFDWWILGENGEDYLQVAVRGQVISSIFVLGKMVDLEPFEIGMDLTDIAELTTIYSNFDFDYREEHYKIDLSEEDMNYRPLIAYDNGSFALLHLSHSDGKLIGVRYLDKQTLVELMPYQLNEGSLNELEYPEQTDWELINGNRQRQLHSLLMILSQRDGRRGYSYLPELSSAADKTLSDFVAKPEEILSEPKRLEALRTTFTSAAYNQVFSLTASEFDKLISASKIEGEGIHGLVYGPSYDVPFLALTWQGDSRFQRQFMQDDDLGVGIAFKENLVLFLFVEESTAKTVDSTANVSSQEESR